VIEIANPVTADYSDGQLKRFTRIFILDENIYATRSNNSVRSKFLDTISKNAFRGITLPIRAYMWD
jgi:hypothetical protein